jgi:hypothetical protein
MNKNNFVILFACVIVVLILFWFLHQRPSNSPVARPVELLQTNKAVPIQQPDRRVTMQSNTMPASASSMHTAHDIRAQIEQTKQAMTNMALLWRTPLLYYGKVIDESNQPISGVRVSYGGNSINESLIQETRNEGSVTTDERGIFKIDGLYGIGLMFQLSHPNYYPYPDNSTGFDVRSRPRDGIVEDSETHARIFHMHSKGHPVPLMHRADGINVPLDGTAKTLDLRGTDYNQKIGQLVVEATGNPPQRYDQQPFDWDAKVIVPDGGLIEYTNQFDFVAPDSGYQSSVEFAFPKEVTGWTDTVSKNYFVKLPSGYMRLNIYIGAKRPLFFSVEYDYNPAGSPNLERAR